MKDYAIIDADGHLTEKDDDYRQYLPDEYQRRPLFPRDNWDRSLGGKLGKSYVDVPTALQDIELEGIDIMVAYPTNGLGIGLVRERPFAAALARAYNDWLHAWCKTAPHKLKGVALIAPQNVEESVQEIERAATELGMVGVMFPTYIPGRDPADPQFHPIYAACERHDLPVAFHATVRESIGVARHMENFLAVHTCSHSFEQMLSLCSTVIGGIPELFPRLKLGFLEAGCAWVPYWMERLDEEWEKRPGDAPHLKRKPSEYIRGGRIFISSEPEEALLPWVLEHVGEEIILYASDYPHWDSGYPYTVKTLMERADVTAAQKRKIFYENPSRFYRL